MTASNPEKPGTEPEVLHFDTRPTEAETADAGDRIVHFTLDDDPTILTARRPKARILLRMARIDVDALSPLEMASVIDEFIAAAFDQPTQDYLNVRFDDPEDDLEYDALVPIINALKERWFGRPTGRPTGSRRPQTSPGKRSTARARSRA